jgi:hypothetical protein
MVVTTKAAGLLSAVGPTRHHSLLWSHGRNDLRAVLVDTHLLVPHTCDLLHAWLAVLEA